jgi:two-component system phosphate regulon sensor histidine kinase PhoR
MVKRPQMLIGGVVSAALFLPALLGFDTWRIGRFEVSRGLELLCASVVAIGAYVLFRAQADLMATLSRDREEISLLRGRLQEQEQAIDFFADDLDLGIFICDESGTVSYANQTARSMFQFSNPTGRSLLAITVSYDLEQLVLNSVKTRALQTRELMFHRPQERNAVAKAWMNPDNNQVFVSILDVSNLRRLERVRQDFVANVSHELRTPMSIIRAYAETLLDEDLPDPVQLNDYLRKMIAEVDRLSGLTRDLLILSAAELEQVQKQPCNIAAICASVVAELFPKAEQKELALQYHGPAECVIEANSSQMTQVILNLVDNALNYTVKGSVDVKLALEKETVTIQVIDTGIGVGSEHANRIFERFYRVDKGRSRSTGGTGLGLSIVKHIVEAHEGNVRLDSALNEGSTFTVWLPVRDSNLDA